MRLLLLFLLLPFISFSQNKKNNTKNQPLFISTIGIDNSYSTQNKLDVVTNSIKTISSSTNNFDTSNFVALTSENNKVYKFSELSSKIDLSQALDNVMFTGNFFNPKETHFSSLINTNH
ncbi:MAG: hypothetical protein ACPG41_06410 [Lacinutrix venerupis]